MADEFLLAAFVFRRVWCASIRNRLKIKVKIGLKGYWTNGSVSQFNNLDSGVYTIVAGDEWSASTGACGSSRYTFWRILT